MDKPKFNLDAHSILLLCNGEQVDTDAGKLQLTIVQQAEQSEQAKPVIDLHKDSWAVLNDGSQRFKDTVIKWLNEQNDVSLVGGANSYYGKDYTGVFHYSPSKHRFTHILTIDEFCALAYPKEKESELVGKWVRCTNVENGWCRDIMVNSWYQIVKYKSAWGEGFGFGDYWGKYSFFDLSNPLDYNPETLVGKYYEGNKIEAIYFDDDEAMIPRFKLSNGLAVLCKIVTPSDVTDTPPTNQKPITDLEEINTSTKEGRLLFAALAKITTESQTDKTPYEVLEQIEILATKMDSSNDYFGIGGENE